MIKPGSKDEMIEFGELSNTGGIINLYEAVKMVEAKYAKKIKIKS